MTALNPPKTPFQLAKDHMASAEILMTYFTDPETVHHSDASRVTIGLMAIAHALLAQARLTQWFGNDHAR